MALTVEDGTGVVGADSYAALAATDTYWFDRPHRAEYTAWNAASDENKEGALREATAYLDAVYGPHYRGQRRGRFQSLLWPRSDARDNTGELLPDLPPEIVTATYELAARAVSAPLDADKDRGGMVTAETIKAGEVMRQTTYSSLAPSTKRFGMIDGMLAEILDGTQPNSQSTGWAWA